MHKLWREVRRIGNHVVGSFLNVVCLPLVTKLRRNDFCPDSLLILKLDAPGDYILFRNFLEDLRRSAVYGRHQITLLGNPRWQEIATRWDSDHVDQFVWLDPQRFRREAWYRFRTLCRLQSSAYETLIVPTHSRTRLMDHLAHRIRAQHKIAPRGDRFNLCHYPAHDTARFYTRLLPSQDGIHFEFQRNREFIEHLLGQTIRRHQPQLPDCEPDTSIGKCGPYAILAPGAGHHSRQWPAESFAEIARTLNQDYQLTVILVGTSREEAIGRFIAERCPAVINRIGQTLTDTLVELIAHSKLVVTNETAAIHIAAALNITAICISNGSHFGRFHPYPPDLPSKPHFIYPRTIRDRFQDIEDIVHTYSEDSPLDICTISVSHVKSKIALLLTSEELT